MHRRRDEYYAALNAAQRGTGEVTPWLGWFLETFTAACRDSGALIDEALVRARFWTDHRETRLSPQQRKVLGKMLDAGPGRFEGGITARKYQSLTGASKVTASRHLADMLEKGLIVRAEGAGGRSTYYDLAIPGWAWQRKPER